MYLALWRTYDRLRAFEDDLFSKFDLTPQQYNLLRLLDASHPGAVTGYLALVTGGVGLFFLVRALGDGLSAPLPPADARAVGRPMPGQVDVVLHVTATLAAVIGLASTSESSVRPYLR